MSKIKIKVLSLCDGKSGGLIALTELKKEYDIEIEYHAVEIDKHARKLSDENFGINLVKRWQNDVKLVTENDIKKHGPFDFVIMGTPCQSVSVSGKYCGDDSLDWIHDKSGVLIDCMKIVKWVKKHNPNYKFLIENVKMKAVFLGHFNHFIGREPLLINSNLVSGQNRARYYWTNFKISLPDDKNINCNNVINNGFFPNELMVVGYSKSTRYKDAITGKVCASPAEGRTSYIEKRLNISGKINTLVGGGGCQGQSTCNWVLNQDEVKKMLLMKKTRNENILNLIESGKIKTRKLSVKECARFQTIPDWFDFSSVSERQAYKVIGLGWTIEVIKHIFKQGLNLK